MRSLRLIVLCSILISFGCASVPGVGGVTGSADTQSANVTMSQVSADLAQYEGDDEMDILAASPVDYEITGNARYDEFFQNSAVVYASVVTGEGLMSVVDVRLSTIAARLEVPETAELVERVQAMMDSGNALTAEETAEITGLREAVDSVATALQDVPDRGEGLLTEAGDLVASIPDEFSDSPMMVGNVQDSMETAQSNLQSAVESSPNLLEQATAVSTALTNLAAGVMDDVEEMTE